MSPVKSYTIIFALCLLQVLAVRAEEVLVILAPPQSRDISVSVSVIATLERHVSEISDVTHPRYGQHMSSRDIAGIVQASPECIKDTRAWLQALGGQYVRVWEHGDAISSHLPSRLARHLVRASSHDHHRHEQHDTPLHIAGVQHQPPACVSFITPHRSISLHHIGDDNHQSRLQHIDDTIVKRHQKLHDATDHVDTSEFHRRRQHIRPMPKTSDSTLLVTADPNAQRKSYGIPTSQSCHHPNSAQMVWGPGTYGYSTSDLATFYKLFHIDNALSYVNTSDFRGTPGGDNFGEATLDTQQISSIAPRCHTMVSNTNTSKSTEETYGFGYAFLDMLVQLTHRQVVPNVLSMSLGSLSAASCRMLCEIAVQETQGKIALKQCHNFMSTQRQVCMLDSEKQSQRMSVEFMKLAARGVTAVAASGDGGSHYSFQPFSGSFGDGCSDCPQVLNSISCEYNFPTFPGTSPYVTAVGGSQWGASGPDQPQYWNAGGGGFSWQFPQPKWQAGIVDAYLQSQDGVQGFPNTKAYNGKGRGYPDVVAVAIDVPIVESGFPSLAGGTSAAAPVFGGIVSLLNDVRLMQGLPPLGWLNPRLYAMAHAHPGELFYDIEHGNTRCNSGGGACCHDGFTATKGWDAATGLGSPLWPGLVKHLTKDDDVHM